jgi:hypothetical protein
LVNEQEKTFIIFRKPNNDYLFEKIEKVSSLYGMMEAKEDIDNIHNETLLLAAVPTDRIVAFMYHAGGNRIWLDDLALLSNKMTTKTTQKYCEHCTIIVEAVCLKCGICDSKLCMDCMIPNCKICRCSQVQKKKSNTHISPYVFSAIENLDLTEALEIGLCNDEEEYHKFIKRLKRHVKRRLRRKAKNLHKKKNKKSNEDLKFEDEEEDHEEAEECCICLDNAVSSKFLPCNHVITCNACSSQLKKCPICRSDIIDTLSI